MKDKEMVERILNHIHNYFEVDVRKGHYTISNHTMEIPFLQNGQYFRIVGSVFNDGVYKYPCNTLQNESFDGEIWAMAVPPAVIALSLRISEWESMNSISPYSSESFGGYSYTKATVDGKPLSWQEFFKSELNKWSKIS